MALTLQSMVQIGWPVLKEAIKSKYVVALNKSNDYTLYERKKTAFYTHPQHRPGATFEQLCDIAKNLYENGNSAIFKLSRLNPDDMERIGDDVLNGRNVSGEELIAQFGLAGLQFGASMSDAQKQHWINRHFEALHDMSQLLDIPPKWIGLKQGSLAFCARGRGGAGVAHYEQGYAVINITCANGKGSFAHEWAHFFDHYLRRIFNVDTDTFASCVVRNIDIKGYQDKYQPLRKAFIEFHKFVWLTNKSAVYLRSRKLGYYWFSELELFARMFESFIEDELSAKGLSSPWLVNSTRHTDHPNTNTAQFPYAIGKEREIINGLIRKIFEAFSSLQ
ncbi:MAG: LPD1 domain-containing protein [Thiomicrospira sp.]